MEESELNYLARFYNKLCTVINKTLKKSTSNKSPLMIFFNTSKKNILNVLNQSELSKSGLDNKNILTTLLNKKLIREGEDSGKYLITAKGVWEYETKSNLFLLDDFLGYIDEEFFNLFKSQKKPLDFKEMIVLFGMIAIRAFSKDSWIDVNIEENTEKWKTIFDKSNEMLLKLEVITKGQSEKLWKKTDSGKGDITNPVFYLLRHMNHLPAKTNNIFRFSGQKQYYIDYQNDDPALLKANIITLLRKIFNKKELNESEREKIFEFLKEISFNYSPSIYFTQDHKFSTPKFDEFIREIILFYDLD